MKSLKEYSLNLTEEAYHALPAWSYSLIARYAREGFSAISTLHEPVKPNDAMRFGTLFDAVLTHGGNAITEFEVMNVSVPEAEKKVLDTLATITTESYELVSDEDFQKAISTTAYQPRWKFETQLSHLAPYADYYNKLKSGKPIVSEQEWSDAVEMYWAVKNHPFLKDHFKANDENGIEYIYQPQFKATFNTGLESVELKCMFDMLEVNHNDKTIRPWDVKTSGMPGFEFADHFVKMRYDIQSQIYVDVLQAVINDIPEYSDYTILPYYFMDISRTDKEPVTLEYNPRSESQQNGLSFESNGRTVKFKHYRQLLAEILSYEASNAKLPSYINANGPTDLLKLLNK
ncbi:MAG: PD-(D/E)XK nuclease family protein [Clostridium sp.]|nr:PD-(D/E)XK nuclease family protein [Clostridium sp.]